MRGLSVVLFQLHIGLSFHIPQPPCRLRLGLRCLVSAHMFARRNNKCARNCEWGLRNMCTRASAHKPRSSIWHFLGSGHLFACSAGVSLFVSVYSGLSDCLPAACLSVCLFVGVSEESVSPSCCVCVPAPARQACRPLLNVDCVLISTVIPVQGGGEEQQRLARFHLCSHFNIDFRGGSHHLACRELRRCVRVDFLCVGS